MGGSYYIVYIGRDLTSQEQIAFDAKYENAEQPQLGHEQSDYKIDGYNVAYEEVFEEHVVCQHYIGTISSEYFDDKLHEGIDYTKFPNPHDCRYKLRIRYAGY